MIYNSFGRENPRFYSGIMACFLDVYSSGSVHFRKKTENV